jgi:putative PEP-CTERM system histidine kinase
MNLSELDLPACSALLAALAYTAFAMRLVQTGAISPTPASLLYGAGLVSSAAWGWAGVLEPYFTAIPTSVVALFDLLRYGCWFAFLLALLAPAIAQRRQRGIAMLAPVAAALVALDVAALAAGWGGDDARTGWARLALFCALALPVMGLLLVEQLLRNVADDSRWNAKPLCLGLGVVFLFDLYVFSQGVLFGHLDVDALSIRGSIHALAVPFLILASRRRRDWIAQLQMSRTAAFHSAALVLAGGYLLMVAAIGYYIRYFGGSWGSALQMVMLCAALVLFIAIAISGTTRSRLRVLVGKHFFSYRYDYREEWLRFTAMLSPRSTPAGVGTLVIRGMADMVESPAGALWMRDPGQVEFVQAARWNVPALDDREPTNSAFSSFLLGKGWIIDLEQFRNQPERYAGLDLPHWLAATKQFWLIVPLIVADDLIGFVALGPPRTPVDLNWEVTDLLKTASRQAAGFLAQMRATEALLETRKFDAFNRMSAFVVHDLKNIVTQLSLMMKNAQRLHDNPEFQQDMLTTVESSLEKMRQLMLQLREGEAPAGGGQSGVDLAPIVRRIETVAAERGRTVEVRVVDPVVTRGHEGRIERVLGHVVQNALDATQPTDRVWLTVARCSGQARVEVGDTGQGMSKDYVQTRLFKPFETTKTSGMGIGAYESFQYVRELGGSISVDSELKRGTLITIVLPLFESQARSDLQMSSAK